MRRVSGVSETQKERECRLLITAARLRTPHSRIGQMMAEHSGQPRMYVSGLKELLMAPFLQQPTNSAKPAQVLAEHC